MSQRITFRHVTIDADNPLHPHCKAMGDIEVGAHLIFGGLDEPQARPIPEQPRCRPHGVGDNGEDRIERARIRSRLLQARLAPGQMIGLFLSGSH